MTEPADSINRKQAWLENARRFNAYIARTASRRRATYFVLVLVSLLAGGVLLVMGQYVFGMCGIGLAVLFGLQFLDAHGHLQEIRRRPVGTLTPRNSEYVHPAASERPSDTVKRPT